MAVVVARLTDVQGTACRAPDGGDGAAAVVRAVVRSAVGDGPGGDLALDAGPCEVVGTGRSGATGREGRDNGSRHDQRVNHLC